jgi:hypothetical protein
MSKPINDGGPAFPLPPQIETYRLPNGAMVEEAGMSLRDWFAGQALAGALQNYTTIKFGCTEKEVALGAYRYADAMLAARMEGKQ